MAKNKYIYHHFINNKEVSVMLLIYKGIATFIEKRNEQKKTGKKDLQADEESV